MLSGGALEGDAGMLTSEMGGERDTGEEVEVNNNNTNEGNKFSLRRFTALTCAIVEETNVYTNQSCSATPFDENIRGNGRAIEAL